MSKPTKTWREFQARLAHLGSPKSPQSIRAEGLALLQTEWRRFFPLYAFNKRFDSWLDALPAAKIVEFFQRASRRCDLTDEQSVGRWITGGVKQS